MKHLFHRLSFQAFLLSGLISFTLPAFSSVTQDDTVKIAHVYNVPVIDGVPDDACWDSAVWQVIDQVWIPYGTSIDSSDFYGRYKVLWSSTTNLLYFLTETTDNIFVDGYIYPNGNYPDFDVLEVFIDENRSKGKHVFDGTGQTGQDWGYNAENAFSYHIEAMAQDDGVVTYDKIVCDIAGTSWSDEQIPNYEDHFPEFALKKNGNQYTWEFSLKVFRDTYNPKNPSDTTMAILKAGKVLGLDIAYCDDDTPHDIKRKSFIGSSYVTAAKYNDHWMDAGDFGAARLEAAAISTKASLTENDDYNCYYSSRENSLIINLPEALTNKAEVRVYNLLGELVYYRKNAGLNKTWNIPLPSGQLKTGIYLVNCNLNGIHYSSKININEK